MNLTLALAIWGAVLSTILAAVEIAKIRRDRADIRVTVRGGYRVYPTDHPYNPYADKSLISITAANRGRRTVTITQAGLLLPRGQAGRYSIAAESLASVELTEGKGKDYHMIEERMEDVGLSPDKYVAYVRDAMGRVFWSHNVLLRLLKLHRFH